MQSGHAKNSMEKSERVADRNAGTDNAPYILYEYAVIRYVPSIEREEFLNIGLIMMCKRTGWIRVRTAIDFDRLQTLAPRTDLDALRNQLAGFERIAHGDRQGGIIADLEPHERFRWLTAVRSATLQTSRPHPGLTADPAVTFDHLFATLVTPVR